jgi:hemolysin activation/secretion protein
LLALLAAGGAQAQTAATDAPQPAAASAHAAQVRLRVVPDAGPAGNALVTRALAGALKELGERPANLDEVNAWSARLSSALRQGGFPVGQVLMTQDDWSSAERTGAVVFSVFPGRVGQIGVENTSRVADARLKRLVSRALCGADTLDEHGPPCLLQTKRLERATQLLQDVPGVGMAGAPRFSAGQAVGDVQVVFGLEAQGKPVQVGAVLDGNGMPATGRLRAGVSVSGNNIFHAGDAYALMLTGTEKKMWSGSASASTPLGSSGLRLAGLATRQQYNVNSVTRMAGVSNVVQAGVQYPFARGLDLNAWGSLWLMHNQANSNLSEFGVKVRSSINSVQLAMQANNGDRALQLRTNRWGVQSALTLGHNSNNDPGDVAARRAGNYAKLTGSAFGSYGLNADGNLFVTGQVAGQVSSRNLDASEQLALGGPQAVRAYRADEGSVDEGVLVNLGLYRRIPVAVGHQLQVGAFVDAANGRVNHSPWADWAAGYVGVPGVKNVRALSGYGLSLDWLTPVGGTISLAVARPFGFSQSSWADPGKKPIQYWLSAVWSY